MDLKKTKRGFIGGGIMAENILKGILQAGLIKKTQITVSDLNTSRLTLLKKQFNIKTEKDNKKIAENEKLKYEIAEELGLLEKVHQVGWKSLTAKETGRIGGLMTKRKRSVQKNIDNS